MDAARDRSRYDTAQVLRFAGGVLCGLAVVLGLFGLVRMMGGSDITGMVWTSMVPALACLGLGTFLRAIAGYDPDGYDADLFE